jgi:hypothetical protein
MSGQSSSRQQQRTCQGYHLQRLTVHRRLVGATSAEAQGSVPFSDVGNPVMAQLAFLTTMLSTSIAAAAAQRALEVRDRA